MKRRGVFVDVASLFWVYRRLQGCYIMSQRRRALPPPQSAYRIGYIAASRRTPAKFVTSALQEEEEVSLLRRYIAQQAPRLRQLLPIRWIVFGVSKSVDELQIVLFADR